MKKLFFILLTLISSFVYAQRIKLIEGDLSPLKGQTAIKITFTYDNMTIGKDNLEEQKYIADKKVKLDEKDLAG